MTPEEDNRLGSYLKQRRAQLDPVSFGFNVGRRRTPGLRREEVAQRANISATWYTWLEQGRGGNPSADVLDRIAKALHLTALEREHLFLIGLGRPPEVRYGGTDPVTPRLQRLLDSMPYSPAIVRTVTWDVLAWNRAAAAVMTDYGGLPPDQRNVLKLIFTNERVRQAQHDWRMVARFVVGAFKMDIERAGAIAAARPLIDELLAVSPDFAVFWREPHVQDTMHVIKRFRHPEMGEIGLEYSSFAADDRQDLHLNIYMPATDKDSEKIRRHIAASD